jgi:hypothetical protein
VHDVADDADHGEPGAVSRGPEPFAERIALRPILSGERRAHDRDLDGFVTIGIREQPASQQGDPQRAEEPARGEPIVDDAGLGRMQLHALGEERAAVVVEARRDAVHHTDIGDGRDRAHPRHDAVHELPSFLGILVGARRQVDRADEHVALVVAQHAVHGAVRGHQRQGRSEEQRQRERHLRRRQHAAQPVPLPSCRRRPP